MTIRASRRLACSALLLLAACGDAPSPLGDPGPIDRIVIQHRARATAGYRPSIVSRDSGTIAAIARLAETPGHWTQSWRHVPTGDHAVTFYDGRRFVAALRFSPGLLLIETPKEVQITALDPPTFARLLDLTSWWPPRPADYAATDTLDRPAAAIDYDFDPGIRRFRDHLEGARRKPADFDGHYRFVVWGCGPRCTRHLLLDLRSGRTYADTLVDFGCGGVEYHRASGLVITGPDTTGAEGVRCADRPVRYFAWDRYRLVELHPGGSHARTRAVAAP